MLWPEWIFFIITKQWFSERLCNDFQLLCKEKKNVSFFYPHNREYGSGQPPRDIYTIGHLQHSTCTIVVFRFVILHRVTAIHNTILCYWCRSAVGMRQYDDHNIIELLWLLSDYDFWSRVSFFFFLGNADVIFCKIQFLPVGETRLHRGFGLIFELSPLSEELRRRQRRWWSRQRRRFA